MKQKLFTYFLLCSSISFVSAQTNKTFFLGHSLINFNVPNMVDKLSVAGSQTFTYNANIGNGATLKWHWENPTTGQGDQWDLTLPLGGFENFIITEAVPLQNHLLYSDTYRIVDSLYQFAELYNPNIQYYIYETWHCTNSGNGSTSGAGGYPCDWDPNSNTPWRDRIDIDLPKWESIADSINLLHPNQMLVIPAGQALGRLYDTIQTGQVPGLTSLFDLFTDVHHLDNRGNYFIACVMYSVIHGVSPVGLPNQLTNQYGNLYSVYPTQAQAAIMQEIAWQTVCDYQRDGVNCTLPPLPEVTCNYLSYDGFDYAANLTMEGMSGGTGWLTPWNVQNEDETFPGYSSVLNSLPYSDLQLIGNASSGGLSFLTMGRRLNTTDSGPFTDFVSSGNNGIGTLTGDTLWTSFVLSKDVNNDDATFVSMHNHNLAWCNDCTSEKIAVGYFGSNSNSSGQRYWSLNLNGTYYLSPITVSINQPTLLVVRTIFAAGNTQVDLYVNPSTIGNNGIPSPSISQSTGSANVIRSIATYLGDAPNRARIDEIRMGISYACVTPDPNVVINLPPTAVISMTPSIGMSPLSVTLQASGSSDPENQPLTYLWHFGDGSPSSNLENPPVHLYDEIGELSVALTVTDDTGQAHTTYQTLTLLDADGSFPCQSTVTCLQMASCTANNGIVSVNAGSNSIVFKNSTNQIINPTVGTEYHNLAAGNYTAEVTGASNACTDSFNLQIRVDSTTCSGWIPSACAMQIGTNMSSLADWSVERPFRNLMKNVRPGIITYSDECFCYDADVVDQVVFDPAGYPTFLPQTTSEGTTRVRYVVSSDGGNLRPDSTYILLYDGVGVIDIFDGTIISSVPNRIEFVAGSGNVIINVEESTVSNHLRNFRLLRLADENADLVNQPFYQSYVDKIAPFTLLRFMDWGVTNNNPIELWTERSSTDYFTYATDAGVPYEFMIQLANQLQQDVWICVPHRADNNFITEMATLFKNGLDDNLTIYIEYSNEVWNWIFDQAHYNNENKPSNLSYGRAMAAKAKNVFDIWHNEFSGEECRVKRVLGIQGGFNYLNEEILSQLSTDDWDYGSPTHYFGLDHSNQGNPILDASSTYQDVMLNSQNNFDLFIPQIKQDYRNIHIYGKEVITYEGGQHFVGNSFGVPYDYQNAMWDAQNSQEMYDMYDAMHDSIRSWGCKLATNFSLATVQESVYGSWGVLPDIDVLPPYSVTAKKYQAVLDNLPDGNCSTQNNWNGNLSINWSNPCNWDKNRVPTDTDHIVIPSTANYQPSVDMASQAASIKVAMGAILTILTGWNLDVN